MSGDNSLILLLISRDSDSLNAKFYESNILLHLIFK